MATTQVLGCEPSAFARATNAACSEGVNRSSIRFVTRSARCGHGGADHGTTRRGLTEDLGQDLPEGVTRLDLLLGTPGHPGSFEGPKVGADTGQTGRHGGSFLSHPQTKAEHTGTAQESQGGPGGSGPTRISPAEGRQTGPPGGGGSGPSRERRARPTEHNKTPDVIQHMAKAYPANFIQTLIVGLDVRYDETARRNDSPQNLG